MLNACLRPAAIVLVMAAAACGGGGSSSSTPTTPTPTTPTPTTGGGSASATITITASGVSPNAVTVTPGGRVTFVNNDTRSHDMASDPHPSHGDCPPLNDVGFLTPGQTKTSGNLNTVGTCGFHDHDQPSNRSLLGTITVR
jgi:plastocyanin